MTAMANVLYVNVFLLICALVACCASDVVDEGKDLNAAREEAQYYLDKLQKSIVRISTLEKRSLRTKRDESQAHENKKTEHLFKLLINFCAQLRDMSDTDDDVKPGNKTEVPATPTPSGPTHDPWNQPINEQEAGDWLIPEVRPTDVVARRDGDLVHLNILVDHSGPIQVTRVSGFEVESIRLEGSNEREFIRFTLNTSGQCLEEYSQLDEKFYFTDIDLTKTTVYLRFEACGFDKFQNTSIQEDWETRQGPQRQHVRLPRLRFGSGDIPKIDGFTVTNGKNETYDLTVEMDRRSIVVVGVIFFDEREKKMIRDAFVFHNIDHDSSDIQQTRMGTNTRQLFHIQILNSSVVKDADRPDGPEDNVVKTLTFRVTLFTASGDLRGKVYISGIDRFGTYYNHSTIEGAEVTHEISVRLTDKSDVLPPDGIVFTNHESFRCNENGNVYREEFGKNCTVSCTATGLNLTGITITKKDSSVPVYRSLSHRIGDRMYARVDLGAASPSIEGTYVCEVTNGYSISKSTEFDLYTSGEPKIDRNVTRVEDLGNEKTRITCAVEGTLPINVSVDALKDGNENPERLDNKTSTTRTTMISERGLLLTLEVTTDLLRYPTRSIVCYASSPRGFDSEYFNNLENVVPNYNPYLPKIESESSGIRNLGNGTTEITCTASSRAPMDIWISIGGTGERYRIDDEPEYQRIETPTGNGTSVKLIAGTRSLIRSTSWLYCVAKNEFDSDYKEFYLRDYIDWNLKHN